MYFDESIKISPDVPEAVRKRIAAAKSAYERGDKWAFEDEWDRLEHLIKGLKSDDAIQGKDFYRLYEMFGKDWWNVDPNAPDVEVKLYGPDTPLFAPIYKKLAEQAKREQEEVTLKM